MRDPSWIEKYRATVPSIVAKHGGRYLARGGNMETLEGSAPLPTSYVVLEFPSMDKALAFHVAAYDGSMSEWVRHPELPLTLGSEP